MADYVVGIAGGIGSGKTLVSDRFHHHGIEVVDADVAARKVVEPGEPALGEVADRFGADILLPGGGLDRAKLRERIFHDPEERRWLERLLHPRINRLIAEGLAAADSPYAILVNPLMRHRDPRAHRILVVDVPEAIQVQRTMARDNVDRGQARAIIRSQLDRASRQALADDLLTNDGSIEELHAAVDRLHRRYVTLASGLAR